MFNCTYSRFYQPRLIRSTRPANFTRTSQKQRRSIGNRVMNAGTTLCTLSRTGRTIAHDATAKQRANAPAAPTQFNYPVGRAGLVPLSETIIDPMWPPGMRAGSGCPHLVVERVDAAPGPRTATCSAGRPPEEIRTGTHIPLPNRATQGRPIPDGQAGHVVPHAPDVDTVVTRRSAGVRTQPGTFSSNGTPRSRWRVIASHASSGPARTGPVATPRRTPPAPVSR